MGGFVALLRGINVGGHRKVPMAELRALADGLGLARVRTYVASGNLVFDSEEDGAALEARLEGAIAGRFGFAVDVVVRSAEAWTALHRGNPMPEESAREPSKVMVTIGKRAATDADVAALRARASPNERVERVGEAIWLWFGDGAGRSKLGAAPAGKDVWTTRNWRTVAAIEAMLGGDG
ncbi:MAG TPA: DUF1697 domain-containing protein [Allosphingosinicella sp.]|jgi:uncharacterized protein (DUF1697 family)